MTVNFTFAVVPISSVLFKSIFQSSNSTIEKEKRAKKNWDRDRKALGNNGEGMIFAEFFMNYKVWFLIFYVTSFL